MTSTTIDLNNTFDDKAGPSAFLTDFWQTAKDTLDEPLKILTTPYSVTFAGEVIRLDNPDQTFVGYKPETADSDQKLDIGAPTSVPM